MDNQTIIVPKKELEAAIKESVRDVLNQELMKFRALLLPFVSQKEQRDIEKRYGKPLRRVKRNVEV